MGGWGAGVGGVLWLKSIDWQLGGRGRCGDLERLLWWAGLNEIGEEGRAVGRGLKAVDARKKASR